MIISFVNQKGGVGKTTSAINVAASLKRRNFKVVFIDADPQGSASHWQAVESNSAFEIVHNPEPISKPLVAGMDNMAWASIASSLSKSRYCMSVFRPVIASVQAASGVVRSTRDRYRSWLISNGSCQ